MNFELFDIVKNRPIQEDPKSIKCPYCDSDSFIDNGTRTTLVGYSGKINPNHKWNSRTCKDCSRDYTVESKGLNVWVTDNTSRIYKGFPSCFEGYIYECNCGGDVTRKRTDLEGKEAIWLQVKFENGKSIKNYKNIYSCNKCDANVETIEDYWRGE